MEAVVACLPTLCSREECDELAVNFCYVNSKGARKRMVLPCTSSLHAESYMLSLPCMPCILRTINFCQNTVRHPAIL